MEAIGQSDRESILMTVYQIRLAIIAALCLFWAGVAWDVL
jgi:hypothetical protein